MTRLRNDTTNEITHHNSVPAAKSAARQKRRKERRFGHWTIVDAHGNVHRGTPEGGQRNPGSETLRIAWKAIEKRKEAVE